MMGKASSRKREKRQAMDFDTHVDFHYRIEVANSRAKGWAPPTRAEIEHLLSSGFVQIEPGRWVTEPQFMEEWGQPDAK